MNLKYFTQEAYAALKRDVDLNSDKYSQSETWLDDYFREQEITEPYKESSIVIKDFTLDYSGDDDVSKNNDDLNNIIKVYSAFKDKISPAVAADPLLWTALCHLDYKDYVLKRWTKDDGTVRLNQRFFATEGRGSLLYYNALSRLWWSGYLTYDESHTEDPWWLTKTLLSAQQIQKDLFDQSFSMNREIVKGLLVALKRVQEEKKNACTPLFRKCCHSYLNHYGAVSAIDFLSAKEIENLAYNYMTSDKVKDTNSQKIRTVGKSKHKRKGKKKRR